MRVSTAVLLASLFLASASASAQEQTIRVGYLSQVHDGPIIALREKLGDRYKLEYTKFLRYADAEIALTRGDLDITSLGYVSAITAAARGGDAQYKFFVGQSRGAINLICREDVQVTDWSDLTDHTIGVLTGGPAEIFFNDAVTGHGVALKDIERVTFPVPGPPLLQALQDGTIDCTAVYEPFAASAVADGYAAYAPLDLADNSFRGINGGIAANTEFLKANPEFIKAATEEVVKTIDSYNQEKQPWIASVVDMLAIPAKTAEISTEHLVLDWNLRPKMANVLAGAVVDLGVVAEAPSAEAIDQYFTFEFLSDTTGKSVEDLTSAE